ncbi:MAG: hypothetical protein GF399_05350 [Candidatus Coatesbacteria bacterium]|nr:hypothetical protein [Candidatus Coatesbacteria bacterium]
MNKASCLFLLIPGLLVGAVGAADIVEVNFTPITQQDIIEDTVWDISGSPYVVYGNLTIREGATLRIEDGVTVRFDKVTMDGGYRDGAEIIVTDGALIAEGSPGWPILFTSNEQIPFPGDWGTIVIEGDNNVTLTNCRIEYAKDGLTIQSMTMGAAMSSTIELLEITNCSQHGIAVNGGTPPDISGCTISGNGTGLPYEGGIYLMDCAPTITYNNIFGNNPYNLVNDSIYNIDATYNWWDSVNEQLIAQGIYDYYDRSVLGEVEFIPYLTEPSEDGGGVTMNTWGMIKSNLGGE